VAWRFYGWPLPIFVEPVTWREDHWERYPHKISLRSTETYVDFVEQVVTVAVNLTLVMVSGTITEYLIRRRSKP
jgi:hypothetical protein